MCIRDSVPSIHFQTIAAVPLAIIAPNIDCSVKRAWQAETVDWANLPIILPEHGVARKRFERWFRDKHQGRPNVYAQVSGQEALVSMVALGCGVGLSPIVVVDNSPVKSVFRYCRILALRLLIWDSVVLRKNWMTL